MTAEWRERPVPCPSCGHDVITEPDIKGWIREHEYLDARNKCLWIGDADLWVHKWGERATRHKGVYRDVQYLMMVEIKTHRRDVSDTQRDTLLAVDQLLRTNAWKDQRIAGRFWLAHQQNARVVHGWIEGKRVQLHCYGVHKLRMSGATPEDSEWITWDRKAIGKEQLLKLLAFDISPDTLRPIEHRVHKRLKRDDPLPIELPQAEGW